MYIGPYKGTELCEADNEPESGHEAVRRISHFRLVLHNSDVLPHSVNLGIGKCGTVCGDRVRWQNPPGTNVTNFTKSHDFNWTCLAK